MTNTVVVIGPALAGATGVVAALRPRLPGCLIVEPVGLPVGRIPDAVVFVTSAAAPMSSCDIALLAAAAARVDAVVAAVTKIDVYRGWRAVLDANRAGCERRAVPWVGIAADPEVGPAVVGPLVDVLRAELDDEHRRSRNQLRARQWALRNRIAEHERAVRLRTEAARVKAHRAQARLQLLGAARSDCAALRAEVQQVAASASRRDLVLLERHLLQRARQLAEDCDASVAQRWGHVPIESRPPFPLDRCLPAPRRAVQEDRLAAVLGTGFGLGAALTLGRSLAGILRAPTPAVLVLCAVTGMALAGWVVRTRRLLTARAAMDRRAAEIAAALRAALEERVLAAESAVMTAHAAASGLAESTGPPMVDSVVDGWRAELARVGAGLDGGNGPNTDRLEVAVRDNPD